MDEENKDGEQVEGAPVEPDVEESPTADEPTLSAAELALLQEMKQEGWDESTYFARLYALKELEEQKRRQLVSVALGKFNFFLHLTAFISGLAYLLLLGILYRPALPWVFIPIGLWTIGISYHFYRAFIRSRKPDEPDKPDKPKREKKASKPLGWIDDEPESKEDSTEPDDSGNGG